MAHDWERNQAKKRGGDVTFLELDSLQPEARYDVEPAYRDDPDAAFNRQWAKESTSRAIGKLRERFATKGKGDFFEALKGQLVFGFAVTDAAGTSASRARLFARWLVAWIPMLLIIASLTRGQDGNTNLLDYQFEPLFTWFVSCMLIIWFVGLVVAIVRPTRGLHDQLTTHRLLARSTLV